ncbi:hypothetical protein DAI22_03g367100 [Oryza sativa Japonica Group]|nr:hypothetical protein DAI22_03g367100 [Oryza sativa Japonica Group]
MHLSFSLDDPCRGSSEIAHHSTATRRPPHATIWRAEFLFIRMMTMTRDQQRQGD